ncbi:MAG: gamma-glutamyl-gamma-aminobutyrate hydrolase family protein [Nanoarchaeota archaeon]|nr:gamma-glutamyl-gamma-aminobutyrate hydrolase family protein [Nanoarchaeota archaeon]
MILIISTCREKLHYFEFVKPIERILIESKIQFFTKHYSEIKDKDLDNTDRIIICGTSLKDFHYINDLKKFSWIEHYKKPILGICAGMQIIGLIFGGKLKEKREIVMKEINIRENFLVTTGNVEGYFLHNLSLKKLYNFKILGKTNTDNSIIKHKFKQIYGVLFHPEVRNKKIIEKFSLKKLK